MTGFVLVRFANLYWLVTVSGFQGSSCSGFPAYPAVLSAACRLCCVRRQGDTLRTRRIRVNGFLKLSAADVAGLFEAQDRGKQGRLPNLPGRRDSGAARATTGSLWFLPTHTSFQHALRFLNDVRCGAEL